MYSVSDMRYSPFARTNWHGRLFTTDGADVTDFTESDLDSVLWYYCDSDVWDGIAAGIARLKDGRIVSWETSYGPTGDGFNKDAYGGDTDILCSLDVPTALMHGLTPDLRTIAISALELSQHFSC